ncbi:MAG: J domain-containing protein [Limisphaerales bacterium]
MTVQEALTILEIQGEPTAKSVRDAYMEMIKVWHPDRFPGDAKFQARATRKTQEINSAYRVMQAHFQESQPPPIPEAARAATGSVQEPSPAMPGVGSSPGWCASPDELVRAFVGRDHYRVYPCRLGRQPSDDSPLVAVSTFCFYASGVCILLGQVFGALMGFYWVLFLLSVGLRMLFWLGLLVSPLKHRPDALILSQDGLIILNKVVENTQTRQHLAQNSMVLAWWQLGRDVFAWDSNHELTLCLVDGQPLIVKPRGFVLGKRARQTGYYQTNVATMDELVEMLNQRFPLRA